MKRLTLPHYGGKGHYMKCSESLACNGNCGDCDSLDEIVEKLAEYEDKEEQKPQTNGDRYRTMSDEELARTFAQTGNCPPSSKYGHNCERCGKCWLDYLRQPVKDGDNE